MSPSTWRKLRRTSQIIFFATFVFLLLETEFHGSFKGAEKDIRLPYPVSIFLQIDPLVAISNAISTHSLYKDLIWSLMVIVGTLFVGRFFCGWVCPLGSLNHFLSSLKSEKRRGKRLIESNHYKSWQRLKYYILVGMLVAAVFTTLQIGLLDPISLSTRSFGLVVFPTLNYAVHSTFNSLYSTNISWIQSTTDFLSNLLEGAFLRIREPYYQTAFWLGVIFIVVMTLNRLITRLWCRALCPLGALLGLLSRFSIFGMEKRETVCTDCTRCLLHCQGADEPMPGVKWRSAECHLCLNCVADCPESGIVFKFFPDQKNTIVRPDLKRRKLLLSIGAGVAAVPFLRSDTGLDVNYDSKLIRPPGSTEERDFLARCVRCGQCMKVCPNNALHPTFLEAGVEGIWSPILIPRVGYCEPTCVLCTTVCPTGAIAEITEKQKAWVPTDTEGNADQPKVKPIRIGTAFCDRGRCLPWAMATECIVCEEWCPTSPKAVYLLDADVQNSKGETVRVRQPYIDPERCTGCGACEHACPIQDQPAIYVTSIGETRSKTNQILLQDRGYN
jgi:polyferredoxin